MRRTIDGIVTAHTMDPARRELYVEGTDDETFLKWIVGDDFDNNAVVHPVSFVDIPDVVTGGERERVLALARAVVQLELDLRCLVDADGAHLSSNDATPLPSNTWYTDHCDLEWYVLREECIEKALMLGLKGSSINAAQLLNDSVAIGVELAGIRAASAVLSLDLPVSRAKIFKAISVSQQGHITFKRRQYLSTLLQNSSVSTSRLEEVSKLAEVKALEIEQDVAPFVVRGKDVAGVISEAFMKLCGIHRDHAFRIVWPTFERSDVVNFVTLSEVVEYLTFADSR